MVTKELMDYIANHKRIEDEIRFNGKIRHFLNDFNEKTYNDLMYIIQNEKTIPEAEWQKFYEEYKTKVSSPVLQAIMESDYVPDEIHNNLVEFLIKGEYKDRLNINEQRDHTLLRALTKDNIKDKNIAAIVEYMKNRGDDVSTFMYNMGDKIKDEYYKVFIFKQVTNKAEARKVNCSDVLRQCLINIKDETFLKTILDKFPLEKYRTKILSNPHLSDAFKMDIYNEGVDIRKLELGKLPADILEDVYRSYVEAFFDVDVTAKNYEMTKKIASTDAERQQIKVYVDAKNKLYDIIVGNHLTSSQEYDLFLRFKSMDMSTQQETLSALLRHTKNEQILRESQELKSPGHRDQVFYNEHLPKDMMNKRVDDILTKFKKHYDKTGDMRLTKKDSDYLLYLVENRNIILPKELYFALLENLNYWYLNRISSTRGVPIDVLDKIIKDNKYATDKKDINKKIITKINRNLPEKYKDEWCSQTLYELLNTDSIKEKAHKSCSIGRTYKNYGEDVREYMKLIQEELEKIIKNPDDKLEAEYATVIKNIVEASFHSMSAFDGNFKDANKEDIRFLIHDEMWPLMSYKYYALDFYMQIEEKAMNIKKLLDVYDELQQQEIIAEKLER